MRLCCCVWSVDNQSLCACLLPDIFRLIAGCTDVQQLRQATLLLNNLLESNCTYCYQTHFRNENENENYTVYNITRTRTNGETQNENEIKIKITAMRTNENENDIGQKTHVLGDQEFSFPLATAQCRYDSMLQPFCRVRSYRQLLTFSRCRWSAKLNKLYDRWTRSVDHLKTVVTRDRRTTIYVDLWSKPNLSTS